MNTPNLHQDPDAFFEFMILSDYLNEFLVHLWYLSDDYEIQVILPVPHKFKQRYPMFKPELLSQKNRNIYSDLEIMTEQVQQFVKSKNKDKKELFRYLLEILEICGAKDEFFMNYPYLQNFLN